MPSPTETTFPRPVFGLKVAPNVVGKTLPADVRKIPALGIFDWADNRDGSFTPVVRVKEAWLRVSEAEKLPLGVSAEVMFKLIKGGFVIGSAPAPHSTIINISDLLRHIEECAEDPDFWTTERRKRYAEGM
ncbi:hypothetical protein [Prosthecobacter sp.]|uniref:hypothetical protein n=1 Tax=Prosthecobacter sp. TaxID=1965333 RepID=UPI003783C8F0